MYLYGREGHASFRGAGTFKFRISNSSLAVVAIIFCLKQYPRTRMILSPIIVLAVLLAAFDSAFAKTSQLLNTALVDATHVSRWYLASINLYGAILTAFAFAMIVMACCIMVLCIIMVSRFIPLKGRIFIIRWMSPSKLFELLMPRYRHLHLSMVAIVMVVMAVGTGVFTRKQDCGGLEDTARAARVQYKIMFTNILAIMLCIVLLITYWVLNLLN